MLKTIPKYLFGCIGETQDCAALLARSVSDLGRSQDPPLFGLVLSLAIEASTSVPIHVGDGGNIGFNHHPDFRLSTNPGRSIDGNKVTEVCTIQC